MSEETTTEQAVKEEGTPLKRSIGDLPHALSLEVPLLLIPVYLSFAPIAEYAARLGHVTPFLNRVMQPLMWALSGFDKGLPQLQELRRPMITLSLFYAVAVWVGSAVLSMKGQTLGRTEGYQNRG